MLRSGVLSDWCGCHLCMVLSLPEILASPLGPGELSEESEFLENRTEKKTSGKIEIHWDDLKSRLSSWGMGFSAIEAIFPKVITWGEVIKLVNSSSTHRIFNDSWHEAEVGGSPRLELLPVIFKKPSAETAAQSIYKIHSSGPVVSELGSWIYPVSNYTSSKTDCRSETRLRKRWGQA